jgi:hypothetical protein
LKPLQKVQQLAKVMYAIDDGCPSWRGKEESHDGGVFICTASVFFLPSEIDSRFNFCRFEPGSALKNQGEDVETKRNQGWLRLLTRAGSDSGTLEGMHQL